MVRRMLLALGKRTTAQPKEGDLVVVEGVEGTWHYHLAREGSNHRALCGRRTMRTSVPLDAWDRTPPGYHIPERWCQRCHAMKDQGEER